MAIEIPKISYSGAIKDITLGKGDGAVTVGGETSYPFHLFEGEMPHRPGIAMEVYDCPPQDWPPAAVEPFADVLDNPAAWAKKCIEQYGAEMICLQLLSADPNGLNRPADQIVPVVKQLAESISVPLIVWGCGSNDKDAEVLREIAEACDGKNLVLGPVVEGNYKQIGAAAIAYGHTVAASSPIDINLAKQLNILLGDLGVSDEKILVDPTTGGLGYGIEYTYSVMERDRIAALAQQDKKLQFPMICNMAKEVWKVKEVQIKEDEDPKLGDQGKRGILMEAVTAMLLLVAGADVLVIRHPESVKLIRGMIGKLSSR